MQKKPDTRVRKGRLHVKKGDTVQVLSGESGGLVKNSEGRGLRGRVINIDVVRGRVTVEGVNKVFRHKKVYTDRQGQRQGGREESEASFPACKVMLVCSNCEQATRVRMQLEKVPAGDKIVVHKHRTCRRCGARFN